MPQGTKSEEGTVARLTAEIEALRCKNEELEQKCRRLTTEHKSKDTLPGSEELYRSLVEASPSAIVMLENNFISYANPAAAKMLGAGSPDVLLGMSPVDLVKPQITELAKKRMQNVGKGKANPMVEMDMIRFDGKPCTIWSTSVPVTIGGKPAVILLGQDITDRKEVEQKLRDSLKEKELLLQEVHHRVKNNMAVISSLVKLQAYTFDDPKVLAAFRETQSRILSMALVHEKLYRSRNLSQIDFNDYIRDLGAQIAHSIEFRHARVKLEFHIREVNLDINAAIPCGMLVNELLSNAYKYAFPNDGEGQVDISMEREEQNNSYRLIVSDNGVGLPEDAETSGEATFGFQLINLLVQQLDGELNIIRSPGTTFEIIFPDKLQE